MKLLLIDNNDSFTYNIVNLLREIAGRKYEVINYEYLEINNLNDFTHIIISPGPMKPSDFPLLDQVIAHCLANRKPLLGICLGHQAICTHFGGELMQLEKVVHGQKRLIEITEDCPVFNSLPRTVEAGLYHSWTVSSEGFPDDLQITAHSGEHIMAVQHRALPVYGLQFHPESFLTSFGKEMLTNFSELR